jgi:hypothetical protein
MHQWDLRIFVSAPFEKTIDRARTRDQTLFRSAAEVERRYRSRYIPSQLFYFDTARPAGMALPNTLMRHSTGHRGITPAPGGLPPA